MIIIDTSIDDSHLGSLTQDALLVQLIHACHVMDGVVLVDNVAVEQQLRLARPQEELPGRPGFVDDVQGLEQIRVGLGCLDRASVEDLALEDLEDPAAMIFCDVLGCDRGIKILAWVSNCTQWAVHFLHTELNWIMK